MRLELRIDRESSAPLSRQLYLELRRVITSGILSPGQRMPSTRHLAQIHNISRATVTESYDRLIKEGYINCFLGSGTYVNRILPQHKAAATPIMEQPISFASGKTFTKSVIAQRMPSDQQEANCKDAQAVKFDLARFEAFNSGSFSAEWRRLWLRHWNDCNDDACDADPKGNRKLKEALAHFLQEARAVQCEPANIAILPNVRIANDLIARLLVNPGDTIVVEDPSDNAAWMAAEAYGAKVHRVPVDGCGMNVEALLLNIPTSAKLVYISPAHQFPTGSILSPVRRRALVEWANQGSTFIIEDDSESDFRFSGRPLPSLQGLSGKNESVIYVGSFAKTLSPAVPVAFVVLPDCLISAFSQLLQTFAGQVSDIEQLALAEFIASGHLESHLLQTRTAFKRRREVLCRSLVRHLGQRAVVLGDEGGQFAMIRLRTSSSSRELEERARQSGIKIIATSRFYADPSSAPAGEFVIGYGAVSELKIEEAIGKLAEVVRSECVIVPAVAPQAVPGVL